MSGGSNQIVRLANTVFAQGYLYLTDASAITLDGSGIPVLDDAMVFGELEKAQISFRQTTEGLMGPESLYPLSKAAVSREGKITADWAKIRANLLTHLIGGTITSSAGGPTIIDSDDANDVGNPSFALHLKSPLNGEDIELFLWSCISDDLGVGMDLRKYVKPNWSGEFLRDPVSGLTWRIILPGDQSVDTTTALPALVAGLAATTTIAGEIELNWTAGAGTVTGYRVYRSTLIAGPYLQIGSTVTNRFVDKVTTGQERFYIVTAINGFGEGPRATAVSETAS